MTQLKLFGFLVVKNTFDYDKSASENMCDWFCNRNKTATKK